MKKIKKMKKLFIMLMVAVIAITVIPFNFSSASTDHSANFVTDVKLDTTETTIGQRFQVEYFWAIPDNVDVVKGDTMRVKLPEEIALWDDVSFELRDENNNLVGHGVAKAGSKEVVVTFTDYPVGKVNVHGSMKVWVGVDGDNGNVNGGETTTLTFPTVNGEVKIDIGVTDNGGDFEIPKDEKLAKWGYWYTDEPNTIPWNVRINANKNDIPNAVYTDTLGEGHTFIPESLKIYIGDLDGNGYPTKENEMPAAQVASILTYTAQSFELKLGDISDTISIEYKTRLLNPQPGTIYRNTGELTGTDVNEKIEAGAEYRGAEGNGTGDNETSPVELTKVDNNRPSVNLPGAVFKLLKADGEVLQENLVTNAQGKLTIPELTIGSYQLVETAAPTGYKLDATPILFEITATNVGETIQLQMGNTAEGTVVLTKKDADHADRLLSGAVFSLYKADGTLVSADFQTNSSGTITANLAIGDYYFVETKAPAGYELDATPRHFSITYDNFTDTQNVTVTNKEIEEPPVVEPEAPKGSMELIKRDATDNSKRLAGAEFHLTGDNGESRTITTDATGSAKVADLPVGKYTLVETKAPAGYELDATPHTFEITEANHATVQIVTVDNAPVPPVVTPEDPTGSLELIKRDATDSTNRLAGAEFRLTGDNGESRTVTTDATGGVKINDLPLGKYTLVETKAPAGYELDPTPHTFEITEANHTEVQVVTVNNTPVTPEPPKGSVQLQKVDAANNNGLAGATFQLLDEAGTVIQTVTTNASGILTITDLALGKYSLVETKAPTGYVLDETPVHFEITESNAAQMISLTKENTKIEVPEIHKNVENYLLFDWNVLAQMNNTKAGVQDLTLSNRDDAFVWNIDTNFGNDTANWAKAIITDEINSLLTIEDIQIKDAQGKDVTGNGTLAVDGNNITFTLNKQDDSFAFLTGQTYTMSVRTVIKDGVTDEQLAPFIKDSGIPNQAELAFDNDGKLVSEIPTVTPPTVNPEIHKDIEKQEHLDLTNRDDAFDWNIHTSFGNQTAGWNQAIITDQINNLLNIKNIQITDEKGNDVTANGTITQENNLITFTMNKKDDSFAYLAGHTYTMTVTTDIKDGVTDEQLAPFIKDGGIPNQAELTFGNEGDFVKSEIPTVTPPTVNPEIHKDIEKQEHLDLANRNDAFDWNIDTTFGNQTAKWNQAIITDQINNLLAIKNIQIVDENGNDVTGNGTITEENNLITFTMNKKDDSFAYLAGHTYTMTVTTEIKEGVTDEQLAPFIKDGGIPNQAELAFGNEGDSLKSEIPTVTPPPVNPEIHKDIEGVQHVDLANRNDAFNWNIQTIFGNQTATWNQAIITDQINDFLNIEKIQITDENGNDVTENGTITQENNLITFTMDKKEDSFAYLAGHTYTMTVTTTIKADVTDEQLAPFIQDGGIPNQAELAFNNEGDFLQSEIPTVTPPTPVEEPEKVNPLTPENPAEPTTPATPQIPAKETKTSKPSTEKKNAVKTESSSKPKTEKKSGFFSILPSTGDALEYIWVILGAATLSILGVIAFRRYRKA